MLLANGVLPKHFTKEQCIAMADTGLKVVGERMRVAGVPVGTEHLKPDFK